MLTDDLYLPQADPAPRTSRIKAGFAEADITPAPGMETPGGYVKAYTSSVHDPCKVRAAVFDDGARCIAMVSVDALLVPRPLVQRARQAITSRCGIKAGHILVSATHSHSSGPIGMILPGQFDHASPLVQKLAYEESSCAHPAYLQRVEGAITEAVTAAFASRRQSWLSFGSGHEDKVAFNRRFRMKNGLTYTHPGRGHADIIEPAGPIDPEVGVLGAWSEGGRLLGAVVNYACHATTNPDGFSANWIFYLEQTLRGAVDPGAIVLFQQGASGDITQVNNLSPHVEPPGEESARRVGGCVGAEAVKALRLAHPGGDLSLDAKSVLFRAKRRTPSLERVRQSMEIIQRGSAAAGHAAWAFAKEIVLLDALLAGEPEVEIELQAMRIGPAIFLSTPAEYFVEWGLELKKRSGFAFAWPVTLANGCLGYVPTEEAFGAHGGGYETRLTCYTNIEHGTGRLMLERLLELAASVKPDPVPEPQRAKPATSTWSYGSVGPE